MYTQQNVFCGPKVSNKCSMQCTNTYTPLACLKCVCICVDILCRRVWNQPPTKIPHKTNTHLNAHIKPNIYMSAQLLSKRNALSLLYSHPKPNKSTHAHRQGIGHHATQSRRWRRSYLNARITSTAWNVYSMAGDKQININKNVQCDISFPHFLALSGDDACLHIPLHILIHTMAPLFSFFSCQPIYITCRTTNVECSPFCFVISFEMAKKLLIQSCSLTLRHFYAGKI